MIVYREELFNVVFIEPKSTSLDFNKIPESDGRLIVELLFNEGNSREFYKTVLNVLEREWESFLYWDDFYFDEGLKDGLLGKVYLFSEMLQHNISILKNGEQLLNVLRRLPEFKSQSILIKDLALRPNLSVDTLCTLRDFYESIRLLSKENKLGKNHVWFNIFYLSFVKALIDDTDIVVKKNKIVNLTFVFEELILERLNFYTEQCFVEDSKKILLKSIYETTLLKHLTDDNIFLKKIIKTRNSCGITNPLKIEKTKLEDRIVCFFEEIRNFILYKNKAVPTSYIDFFLFKEEVLLNKYAKIIADHILTGEIPPKPLEYKEPKTFIRDICTHIYLYIHDEKKVTWSQIRKTVVEIFGEYQDDPGEQSFNKASRQCEQYRMYAESIRNDNIKSWALKKAIRNHLT